jgi:hypothetical protein
MEKVIKVNEVELPRDLQDNRCPLFSNGEFVLADCDEAGNILGDMKPVNPANALGRPIMFVMNDGPGSIQVEHNGDRTLISPLDGVFFDPRTLMIDFIAGDLTNVWVSLCSPDKTNASIARSQAFSAYNDASQRKRAKTRKWKVSSLYKSTPRQFEMLDFGDGNWKIDGAPPDIFSIAEKHQLSLMMIVNKGPGAALVKGSGNCTTTLGAWRAMLALVGRTEVSMVEGESAHIGLSILNTLRCGALN